MPNVQPNPESLIGPTLGDCARIWRIRLNERLRPLGLSQGTWLALWHLAQYPDGLVQGELAERLGIEGPTLVRLLDRLESEGLVERRPQAHDRRCKQVTLAAGAGPTVELVVDIVAGLRTEIMAGIPEDELRRGLAFLNLIRERLEGL